MWAERHIHRRQPDDGRAKSRILSTRRSLRLDILALSRESTEADSTRKRRIYLSVSFVQDSCSASVGCGSVPAMRQQEIQDPGDRAGSRLNTPNHAMVE